MTEVIGYAALQVIPTVQGVAGQLDGALVGPMATAGRNAGAAASRGITSGLDQARAAVERAQGALVAARDKEAEAAGKVRIAEAKLEELRAKGITSGAAYVRAEEALATARRNGDRATDNARRAVQQLSDARANMANTTDEVVESEGRFSRAISSMTDRLGPAASQMAAAASAAAGIGTAMALATEAMNREASVDKLAASLAASPAAAAEYGETAGRLYSEGFGAEFGEVTQAVGIVASSFETLGFEGEASLDKVTERAMNFAKTFDTDIATAVQTASQLVTEGLAGDSTQAFDMLTTGFQRIPALMRDELPEILQEYSTHFRGMGFSGEEAFSLLIDQAAAGKFALDKTGDALKEFSLLGSDMSQSSQDAYKALGLDAQQMSDAVASGGQAAQDALQQVATRLLGIEGPAERANLAVALFGTPVEDLALDQVPKFMEALSGAGDSMVGFEGSADRMGATLNDNAASALERVKRELQGGFVEALTDAASWIDQNRTTAAAMAITLGVIGGALVAARAAAMGYAIAQGVMAAATGAGSASLAGNALALGAYTIATGVVRGATLAWSAVQWVLNAALSANPIGIVVVAIGALVAGLVYAWRNSETFREIVTAAWDAIKVAAQWTWDKVLKPVIDWIVNGYKLAWDAAKAAGDGIGQAWQWISDKATDAKNFVVDAFTTVVTFVTGLPGRIRSAASGLWDGITDSFRNALNWLIGKWNSFSLGFDFKIPVIDQKVSFRVDTPDLPLLAGGGVAGRTGAGRLWGPGTGTSDSILGINALGIPTARVSDGEGVVTELAMNRGGDALVAALNAGWVPPPWLLHAMIPGFAEGGTVADLQAFARGEAGKPYGYGATGPSAWDCSAIAGALWAKATGRNPNQRHFNTESDFAAMGWRTGLGGPGDLSIGIKRGGGGPNSHMASTVGDLNVEASGTDGVEVGAGALGAADLPLQFHWPLGGNPTDGGGTSAGGPGGSLLGGNSSGASGGPGGSTSSSGTSSSGGTRPNGPAVLVWVDNMPEQWSPSGTTGTGTAGEPATAAAPAVGGTGVDQHYGAGGSATGEAAADPWAQWADKAAGDFRSYFENNWKEMLNTGLAFIGMGASAGGGGDTYNFNGMSPRSAAVAVDRVRRRKTLAVQGRGRFGA